MAQYSEEDAALLFVLEKSGKDFEDFKSNEYVENLEREYELMQQSFFALTSHLARIQLSLQQIMQAVPWQRDGMLRQLEKIAFRSANQTGDDEMPTIYHDFNAIDQIRKKQTEILNQLRQQAILFIENLGMRSEHSQREIDKDDGKCGKYMIVDGLRIPRAVRKH